jgi:hypothetical protein
LPISFRIALFMSLLAGTGLLQAQAPIPSSLDLSVSYIGERSLTANTSENFWMQGGSIELGANVWRGWDIAANLTGTHTAQSEAVACPLSLVTTTFGPRYRCHADQRVSLNGQGLIGEANGFRSITEVVPYWRVSSGKSIALEAGSTGSNDDHHET